MKAQISLDLMLAVAIALIVIATIGVVSNEATKEQTRAGIRGQLDSLGTELASVISASMVFDDASSARVEFDVPKIHVLGEMKPQPCRIQIAGKQIMLSYELYDTQTGIPETISVSKEFAKSSGMNVQASACGEPLVVTK